MEEEFEAEHSTSPRSTSTGVTTPEQPSQRYDDVWGSDDEPANHATNVVLSDLPSVKRQHMTDGYREGLSVGKAKIMQQGFDEGYPLGMIAGLRVGNVLGGLEGLLAIGGISQEVKVNRQQELDRAKKELALPELLKDLDENVLMQTANLPSTVDAVITRWETVVSGMVSGSDGAVVAGK